MRVAIHQPHYLPWLDLLHRMAAADLAETGKSEPVLNLCKAVGATALIVGLGGSREYLDRAAFAEAGIALEPPQFEHPVYPRGPGPFTRGLSALDLLFNGGPDSRQRLEGSKPNECRIAA